MKTIPLFMTSPHNYEELVTKGQAFVAVLAHYALTPIPGTQVVIGVYGRPGIFATVRDIVVNGEQATVEVVLPIDLMDFPPVFSNT